MTRKEALSVLTAGFAANAATAADEKLCAAGVQLFGEFLDALDRIATALEKGS